MNVPTMVLEDGRQVAVVHLVCQMATERQMPDGLMVPVVDWRIACTPGLQDLHGTNQRLEPWQRSEDVRAVTCPLCKRTQAYRSVRIPGPKPLPKSPPSDVALQPPEPKVMPKTVSDAKPESPPEDVVVHLAVQEKTYWRTACGMGEGKQRSDDVRTVSCSHCKASEDYEKAKAELRKAMEIAWR